MGGNICRTDRHIAQYEVDVTIAIDVSGIKGKPPSQGVLWKSKRFKMEVAFILKIYKTLFRPSYEIREIRNRGNIDVAVKVVIAGQCLKAAVDCKEKCLFKIPMAIIEVDVNTMVRF